MNMKPYSKAQECGTTEKYEKIKNAKYYSWDRSKNALEYFFDYYDDGTSVAGLNLKKIPVIFFN